MWIEPYRITNDDNDYGYDDDDGDDCDGECSSEYKKVLRSTS